MARSGTTALVATASRNLNAEMAQALVDVGVARSNAKTIASEEDASLDSDVSYNAFMRRKKLADREIARIETLIARLEIAIDDDLALSEQAAFERRCADVEARNIALQKRLIAFREVMVPELLKLIRDLAQDEIDTDSINRLLPRGKTLRRADAAVRSRPSDPGMIIVGDEIVERWCDVTTGQIYFNQDAVSIEFGGRGFITLGKQKIEMMKRRFRTVEKFEFRPASDVEPLWKEFVIPRLDRLDAPTYDGRRAYSASNAIDLMSQERREHPRYSVTSLMPVDEKGRIIEPRSSGDSGPRIHG